MKPDELRDKKATFFVFVCLHARAAHEADVAAALRKVALLSRDEAGCVAIDAFQSTTDRQLFYIHSRWVDEAAFNHHATLPHTIEFMERVDALVDRPREVVRTLALG
jgi:quinol monooxygenase YgiN